MRGGSGFGKRRLIGAMAIATPRRACVFLYAAAGFNRAQGTAGVMRMWECSSQERDMPRYRTAHARAMGGLITTPGGPGVVSVDMPFASPGDHM